MKTSPMNSDFRVSLNPMIEPATGCAAEMDRLGDEIAELSAHLDAATGRLLDLIREFDARGGWGNGFHSCAGWLTWRVGLGPGAARERVPGAGALGAARETLCKRARMEDAGTGLINKDVSAERLATFPARR